MYSVGSNLCSDQTESREMAWSDLLQNHFVFKLDTEPDRTFYGNLLKGGLTGFKSTVYCSKKRKQSYIGNSSITCYVLQHKSTYN